MNKPRLLINGKKISRVDFARLVIIEEIANGRTVSADSVKKKANKQKIKMHVETTRLAIKLLREAKVLYTLQDRDGRIKHSGQDGHKVFATRTLARNLKMKIAD